MHPIDSSSHSANRLEPHGDAFLADHHGHRFEHGRGRGTQPRDPWPWSSYRGEAQDLVPPAQRGGSGLMGGIERKRLPPAIALSRASYLGTIDSELTQHLSDELNNQIVDLLTIRDDSTAWTLDYLDGGRTIATYSLFGPSGVTAVALRIDTNRNSSRVSALGITLPDGTQVGIPIPFPAVTLQDGTEFTAPLEVLERHPWLEYVLSAAVAFDVSSQPDQHEPTLLTARLTPPKSAPVNEINLTLRLAPDGSWQVTDAQAMPPPSRVPQAGFSYARGLILDRHGRHPDRRLQFSDITGGTASPGIQALDRMFEAARHADAWTPDALDPKQWYVGGSMNDATVTLCIKFDSDELDHAMDIQRYVPGMLTRIQGERPFFAPWEVRTALGPRCEAIIAKWFHQTPASQAWSAANPSKDAVAFIDDALKACAMVDPRYEGRYQGKYPAPQRNDGTPAKSSPWGDDPARHIYRYDTVLAGRYISMLVEFSHPSRRVWVGIAVLPPGQLDASAIEGIKRGLAETKPRR